MKSKSKYIILITLLIVLIVIPVALETYTRKSISKQITSYTNSLFNTETSTKLGNGIFFKQILEKEIKNINVETINPRKDNVIFTAHLNSIKMKSFTKADKITSLNATVFWTTETIKRLLQEGLAQDNNLLANLNIIAGVSVDETKNALKIEPIGGFGFLYVRPIINNNHVDFEVISASAIGFEMPQERVQSIVNSLTSEIGNVPENITAEKITLEPNGIKLIISGKDVPIK